MDSGTADRRLGDGGVTSVQFVLAGMLAMVVFVALANLVVYQYGRGAVRSALEQGARAGAVEGSAARCAAVAGDVAAQLLGGAMGRGLSIECRADYEVMVAVGQAVFESWTPLMPDLEVAMSSRAVIEPDHG